MYYPSKQEFIAKSRQGNLIPVYKEILADVETPVSAFQKIDEGDYSYLLESVEGGEKIARFSFLGSRPSLIVKTKGKKIEIMELDAKDQTPEARPRYKIEKFPLEDNPLAKIKKLMSKFKFVKVKGLPRFCGGLVGYMGYDTVRFFEKLPDRNPDDLGLADCIFILTDTILIFDHLEHKIKVVANAHIEDNPEDAYQEAIGKIDRIIEKISGRNRKVKNVETGKGLQRQLEVKSNFTRKEFESAVLKAQEYIRAGDIIQVVLSQRFEVELTSSPFDIYRSLRSLNPSPYMYYLKFVDLILVGSSPELHVRYEDNLAEMRPIAGTRQRGKSEKEDRFLSKELLNDPKEKAEHIMLVDLARNDIGRVCDYDSIKVQELMTIEKYSHVIHIVSDIIGRLKKNEDIFSLLRVTFPAGTVSGAPKIRAMEIIDELENIRRGPYAGVVGYFSFSGNLDSCITIRTLVIKGKKAYVQAGAGIVAYSDPAKEYQETVNKARALIEAVKLAQKGIKPVNG